MSQITDLVPTRLRAGLMVSILVACVAPVLAHLVLSHVAYGPNSEVAGVPTILGAAARVVFGSFILGSIIMSYKVAQRFSPDSSTVIDRAFIAFHWLVFVAVLAAAAEWLLPMHLLSGDPGGLLAASTAVCLFPMRLGRIRSIACAILAIASAVMFVLWPNPINALAATGNLLLYVILLWVKAASQRPKP
jgi:hypothetical protein